MPHLHLLGRTLRRPLPSLALVVYVVVMVALNAGPVTLPAVVGGAGAVLLTTMLIVTESRLVETCDEVEDLCRVIGELRTELITSYTDPVTGLPLRRVAERRLAEAHNAGEAVTVALIDIDDMHGVNDVHGHRGGDIYLAHVAWLLADVADSSPTTGSTGVADTVARLGGDEFILISTRPPHAVAVALTALLSDAVTYGEDVVAVRFSAGVHRTDGAGGGEPHSVLGCADLAMYTAKRHGGGVVVYDAGRDGMPSADAARYRSRHRSSAPPTGPTAPAPTPALADPAVSLTAQAVATSGRHTLATATGAQSSEESGEESGEDARAAAPTVASTDPAAATGRPDAPSCWQCGTPSPVVPGGVRRCQHCGAGLVLDADGWISPAEELYRRRAETDARQIAVSVSQVAEALPALAASAPAGWSVTAAVPVIDGALHSVAVHPPACSVDATAYLTPDTDHRDSTDGTGPSAEPGWWVRVHNRGRGIDFPLYTDGGARAARFRTAADACRAAVQALRIEIAEARWP
ncbi:GGDEF domain-containing protein [Dactylosporangium sp. NPDC049525]|uniref:GGDEF domain-containing protein n=1 Tax=Dactylosporangium sp. NPDC049525 TaxID=3154730 RepID=UPI003443DADF